MDRRIAKPPPSAFNRERELLPDLGTRRTGRASLDAPPAYDMKSLGKHLDPVSLSSATRLMSERKRPTPIVAQGRNGDDIDQVAHWELFRYNATDDPRSRPESNHALFGTPTHPFHANVQVNHSRDAIQQRLVTSLYKPDLFAELLFEDDALVAERTRVKALLDAYKEAFRVLSEVSLKSN